MKISNFIGAVLVSSIAITSTFAAPAAAASDGDRLARILLGAAAVGLVVHTVKKNKNRHATVARQDHYRSRQQRARYNNHRPKTCLRKKYTYNGWQTFYSQRCLAQQRRNNNGRHSDARHDYDNYGHAHDRRKKYNNRYNRNTHNTNARHHHKTYEKK